MADDSEFVLDASFVQAFLMPDESVDRVTYYFSLFKKKQIRLYAPHLLLFEVGNALRSCILRKRVSRVDAFALYREFLDFAIVYCDVVFMDAFPLSVDYTLSFYDASYVWLAKEKSCGLLTLDRHLESAF